MIEQLRHALEREHTKQRSVAPSNERADLRHDQKLEADALQRALDMLGVLPIDAYRALEDALEALADA